jgi:hypothetical protein
MDEKSNDYKEAFKRFLECKQSMSKDTTLSPNARKIAEFLCRGIESADDIADAFRLGKLIRGGKYRDELHLEGEELEAALDELNEKKYYNLFN